ncbi:MAG TPA: winged helix DNA-binding domain-containing protein, partial [Candidatus Dormibacteraeota bacterium]|nr:winged helix DNA-binding domain-containing protein [Candidatus Dormibacteraeota bacterium]
SRGLRLQDVMRAINDQRSIARTWLMRGTLHLVASDDLRWMLSLLGPVFAATNRRRHAQLGLDDELKANGVAAIRKILAGAGPATRHEIVARLGQHGIRLDPRTQAPIHLIQLAALQGVCCLGPERSTGEPTYVLLDDWIPQAPAKSAPMPNRLALRYFAAYGPATLEDFAAWSGLPIAQARSAVADASGKLTGLTIRGQTALLPKGRLNEWRRAAPPKPSVRLLPAFDTYLLGYRRRDLAVAPPLQRRLQRGGGWIHPAVVVDGRAIAAWSLRGKAQRNHIAVEAHEPVATSIRTGIEEEAADISRFLNLPISVGFDQYVTVAS